MVSGRAIFVVVLVCVIMVTIGIGIGYGIGKANNTPTSQMEECPKETETEVNPIKSLTPFDPLTIEEMDRVVQFLFDKNILTFTKGVLPSLTDNYIYSMDLYLNNKNVVLNHLDNGASMPGRYAEVHVTRGAARPPDVMKYKVGPLNRNTQIRAVNLTAPGALHYNTHIRDASEERECKKLLSKELKVLSPLLEQSFDGASFPEGGLTWLPCAPPGLKPEERNTAFQLAFEIEGLGWYENFIHLHLLPVTGTISNPGTNTSDWRVHSLYYLNQGPFLSAADLMRAYSKGELKTVSIRKGFRKELFGRTMAKQRKSTQRTFAEHSPPTVFQTSRPRYQIHGRTVHWMGWQLTLSSNKLRGPNIFNIKYKNNRLVYEQSFSDMALLYAGDSRFASNTVYLDGNFGVGMFQDAIKGVDCPKYASLMDTYWWNFETQSPKKTNGICLFEADGQESLWRRTLGYAGGMNNNYLVVRYPTTLGNYDYTFEFRFYLDGSMQTKVIASGYIVGSFWDSNSPYITDEESKTLFGYRVSDYIQGPIHDHTFTFKVDMDVLGRKNSFEVIDWTAGDTAKAMNEPQKPSYFTLFNQTRYLKYNRKEKETGLNIDIEHPKFWVVVNDQSKNKWGVKRGYRIWHMMTGSQVVPDFHPALKSLSYTKNHCWVTRQRDTERYVTGSHDQYRMGDPEVNFENFINGESINNTDIVTWVTASFLHIPTSENFPITTREETGFWLKPFNFFDETDELDMPQYIEHEHVHEKPPEGKPCV